MNVDWLYPGGQPPVTTMDSASFGPIVSPQITAGPRRYQDGGSVTGSASPSNPTLNPSQGAAAGAAPTALWPYMAAYYPGFFPTTQPMQQQTSSGVQGPAGVAGGPSGSMGGAPGMGSPWGNTGSTAAPMARGGRAPVPPADSPGPAPAGRHGVAVIHSPNGEPLSPLALGIALGLILSHVNRGGKPTRKKGA